MPMKTTKLTTVAAERRLLTSMSMVRSLRYLQCQAQHLQVSDGGFQLGLAFDFFRGAWRSAASV